MFPYIIRQGDYLAKLAHRLGFDADAVWNAPENAALQKLRDPAQLHPGDILQVPQRARVALPIRKGTTNKYVAKIPKIVVNLVFADGDDAIADEPYLIEGLGEPVHGSTGPGGEVSITAPVHLREVTLTLLRRNVAFPVRIGDMDPVSEASGVRKRLEHLGCYGMLGFACDEESPSDEATRDRRAIAVFQRLQRLTPTGSLDDETRAALARAHGS